MISNNLMDDLLRHVLQRVVAGFPRRLKKIPWNTFRRFCKEAAKGNLVFHGKGQRVDFVQIILDYIASDPDGAILLKVITPEKLTTALRSDKIKYNFQKAVFVAWGEGSDWVRKKYVAGHVFNLVIADCLFGTEVRKVA